MDTIQEWYMALPDNLKVYWACAIIGSIVFAVQFILTLIGVDASDADIDFSADISGGADGDTTDFGSLSIFSVRNFINFILGIGWGGVCFYSTISNSILLAVVAVIVGIIFVAMFFVIHKQARKLEKNGAFRINNCIGATAEVYLRIPAMRNGQGKIQISIGGSVHEINAMTDNAEMLPSGARVKVMDVIDSSTVLVEKVL